MIKIVADPGCNWKNINDLKMMMKQCKEIGVDSFKPQLWECDALYHEKSKWYDWQKSHELTKENAQDIFNYGKEIGLHTFFSVFDTKRVEWCEEMGVDTYKVAASMVFDTNLREAISKTGKKTIVSDSLQFMSTYGNKRLSNDELLLYCVSLYPAPENLINQNQLELWNGFSDHTTGIEMALIAAEKVTKAGILEEYIIEKHIMIDSIMKLESPDGCCAIGIEEMTELVKKIREMEIE